MKKRIIIALHNLYASRNIIENQLVELTLKYHVTIILVSSVGQQDVINYVVNLAKLNPDLRIVKLSPGTTILSIAINLLLIKFSIPRKFKWFVLIGSHCNYWERILVKHLGCSAKYIGVYPTLPVNMLNSNKQKDYVFREGIYNKISRLFKDGKLISSICKKLYIKLFGWLNRFLIGVCGVPIDECVNEILYVNKASVEAHIVADKKLIKYFNNYYQGERVCCFDNHLDLNEVGLTRASSIKNCTSGVVLLLGPTCENSLKEAISLISRAYNILNFKKLKIRPHPTYKTLSERLAKDLSFDCISNNVDTLVVNDEEINYQISDVDYVLGYYSSLMMMIHPLNYSKVIVDYKYSMACGYKNMDAILDIMGGKRMHYINELEDIFCICDSFDDGHNSSIVGKKFIDVVDAEIQSL
jgi:hypothetical protein